jgi:acyl carrier protein
MGAEGVSGIFQRVLEVPHVDEDSNFFQLGGDSLLAIRVLSAIARDYGTELTFGDFIDAPSPGGLNRKIADTVR